VVSGDVSRRVVSVLAAAICCAILAPAGFPRISWLSRIASSGPAPSTYCGALAGPRVSRTRRLALAFIEPGE